MTKKKKILYGGSKEFLKLELLSAEVPPWNTNSIMVVGMMKISYSVMGLSEWAYALSLLLFALVVLSCVPPDLNAPPARHR